MLIVFAVGFLIAYVFTVYFIPLLIKAAFKLKILDYPDNNLKSHKNPTPYLGGLAVYLGLLASLAIVFPLKNDMFLFLLGSTLLLFVGLLDDLLAMKPSEKFFGQIVATFCFLKAGFFLKEVFFLNIFNIIISFFWILTVINAFNLVDVMDGLATIIAYWITIGFIIASLILGNYLVALFLICLLGALIAFFKFNKPNAFIYLGDSGSLFIGGILATMPFSLPWGEHNIYGFLTPVIICFIPLAEIGMLILIRISKGISPFKGSPDHFSLYLQKKGWAKEHILIYVTIVSIITNIIASLFLINLISISFTIFLMIILSSLWVYIIFNKKH